MLLPVLGDLDGLPCHALAFGGVSLLGCVGHDLLEVVRVQRGQDVEEVVPWRLFAFGVLRREVGHHFGVLGEHRVQALDAELVVLRHRHLLDFGLLHQLLLAGQHLLEKIFVHDRFVRQIELQATWR